MLSHNARANARKARQLLQRINRAAVTVEGLKAQAQATKERHDGQSAVRFTEAQEVELWLGEACRMLGRAAGHLETLAKLDEPPCDHPECQRDGNGLRLSCRFPVQAP